MAYIPTTGKKKRRFWTCLLSYHEIEIRFGKSTNFKISPKNQILVDFNDI
jgi:hypothetical protein